MAKITCPYCKQDVPAESEFCLHCGKQIPHNGIAEVVKEQSGSAENGDYKYSYKYSYQPPMRKKRGFFVGLISLVAGVVLVGATALIVLACLGII